MVLSPVGIETLLHTLLASFLSFIARLTVAAKKSVTSFGNTGKPTLPSGLMRNGKKTKNNRKYATTLKLLVNVPFL